MKFYFILFFVFQFLVGYSNSDSLSKNLFSNIDTVEDEFKEWKDDEFKEWSDDEFSEWNEDGLSSCSSTCSTSCPSSCPHASSLQQAQTRKLNWIYLALAATIFAGFLVRYSFSRNLRYVFLLASLIVFGFYNGGCPCVISSFQFLFLSIFGYADRWIDALWFLALIPITYVFGKVWCGWICHLGAVQEFLFRPGNLKVFKSEKAQKVMQIVRYGLVAVLVFQLAIMGSIYWCKIDPFMAIFNLQLNFNYEYTSGSLLVLLLISSVVSYRPFCRSICPVGISLGWIAKIPGASIIGIRGNCISCKQCDQSCSIDAIIRKNKISILDNKECIACGDCIDSCTNSGLAFVRKNKNNKTVVKCN